MLEPGPDLVDGADLDVDPAVREGEAPHHVLIQIALAAGGPLGPGDPECAGGGGQGVQYRPALLQPAFIGAETDDHVVLAGDNNARTRKLSAGEPAPYGHPV